MVMLAGYKQKSYYIRALRLREGGGRNANICRHADTAMDAACSPAAKTAVLASLLAAWRDVCASQSATKIELELRPDYWFPLRVGLTPIYCFIRHADVGGLPFDPLARPLAFWEEIADFGLT